MPLVTATVRTRLKSDCLHNYVKCETSESDPPRKRVTAITEDLL